MRRHVITDVNPSSLISEQYHKVRTNIESFHSIHKMSVFQLTSTVTKEGKTSTIVNLANTFARCGNNVLVIDMDLRKPKVHRHFMIPNMVGLGAYLTQEIPLDDVIIKEKPNLHLIIAGDRLPYPDGALSSRKLHIMMEQLRSKYDYIFIDSPPARDLVDATLISRLSDGTIFIVGHKKVKKKHALSSIKHLRQAGANIIGSVYTRTTDRLFDTYSIVRDDLINGPREKKLFWSLRSQKQ